MKTYRRASVQIDVADAYADEFGYPSAGVIEGRQHDGIALAAPRVGVGCIEQGAYFFSGEEADQRALITLHRNREHLLNRAQALWYSGRSIVQKRANGGKPKVAATDAIVAGHFEVVEELKNQWCINIAEFQAVRSPMQSLFCKLEKQPHGVSVSRYRSRAGVTLLYQAFHKELLQQLRKLR
ncbi:hypothetical protein LMG27174_07164 [Paraburkholderia rhynchosiae]|uniref:Uncharacterized protein n=1 Tax=Paraburkholderia rhynchosiae TaxID=487049 RepID=A0A6J5CV38_9BURK|nr:hypothetical protein LMG27174_07164 [Paraburkholderia rhynchosiae]